MQGFPNNGKRTTQKFDTKFESIIQQLGKVFFLLNDISENMLILLYINMVLTFYITNNVPIINYVVFVCTAIIF